MSCIDVSVCAVPDGRKADYINHCKSFHAVAKEFGALAVVDAWGDDVPAGKLTDFPKGRESRSRAKPSPSAGSSGRTSRPATPAGKR